MSLVAIMRKFPNLWNEDGSLKDEKMSRQMRRQIKRHGEKQIQAMLRWESRKKQRDTK